MRGIDLPFRVTSQGGLAMSEDKEQVEKLLIVALQPCPSENPFQDLGLAADVIYRINDKFIESEIILEVERLFAFFERQRRARLNGRPIFSRTTEGELQMDIEYVNLETARQRVLTMVLPTTIGGL